MQCAVLQLCRGLPCWTAFLLCLQLPRWLLNPAYVCYAHTSDICIHKSTPYFLPIPPGVWDHGKCHSATNQHPSDNTHICRSQVGQCTIHPHAAQYQCKWIAPHCQWCSHQSRSWPARHNYNGDMQCTPRSGITPPGGSYHQLSKCPAGCGVHARQQLAVEKPR